VSGLPVIRVENLAKEFRRPHRYGGPFGAVRTLLTRRYDTVTAVDGVGFSIEPGELVGYLGPNGAGKSTTIKMLTGVLTPTAGTVEVAGLVPWRDREANARRIGVVFGQRSQLWWDLPLVESLRLVAVLYDMDRDRYAANLERLSALLGLDAFLDTPVRQLSLGQKMRGDLAAAMLYEPDILYLDEPTVGLDVVAKDAVRAFIAEANRERGTTVLLTTHDLADVERLCRRIILIDHGRVLFDGPVKELVTRYAPERRLVAMLADGAGPAGGGPLTLRGPGGPLTGAPQEGGGYAFTLRHDSDVHDVTSALTAAHPVRDLRVVEADLESVIRKLYADSVR
jgi:ABC-2 type transport system ATP-binding protein